MFNLKNYKNFFLLISLLICIVIALFLYRQFYVSKYTAQNSPFTVLKEKNLDFSEAMIATKNKEYAQALVLNNKALAKAQDPLQVGQIKYAIAYNTELQGNYLEAIPLYKAVAGNTSYTKSIRAYAVQQLGRMYYLYPEQKEQIKNETFKDDPYNGFLDKKNIDKSYRNLFQYGSEIYPLALTEAYIAKWYATDIEEVQDNATTSDEGKNDVLQTRIAIEKSKINIEEVEKNSEPTTLLSVAYSKIAYATDVLATTHVPGYSFENAENFYKQAVSYSDENGYKKGNYAVISYSFFLHDTFGNERKDDIQKLLGIFSKDNVANIDQDTILLFKNAEKNSDLSATKIKLIALAKNNIGFKNYLITLGWKEENFKQ